MNYHTDRTECVFKIGRSPRSTPWKMEHRLVYPSRARRSPYSQIVNLFDSLRPVELLGSGSRGRTDVKQAMGLPRLQLHPATDRTKVHFCQLFANKFKNAME